jgi:hypothetical protein
VKNWKKRFFILTSEREILYYSEGERPRPRGVLNLNDVVLLKQPPEKPRVLELYPRAGSRVWNLSFESEQQLKEWKTEMEKMVDLARHGL